MAIETPDHIYGELRKRGFSSRRWALDNGYRPRTVQDCINTYAPCTGKKPAPGSIAESVMMDLSITLNIDLFEGEE